MKFSYFLALGVLSLSFCACGGSTESESGGGGAPQGGSPGTGGAAGGGESSSDGTGGDGTGGDGTGGDEGTGGDDGTGGSSEICSLAFEAGNCLAAFPAYAFDSDSGECVERIYGGCGGNDNRFDTEEECEAACE